MARLRNLVVAASAAIGAAGLGFACGSTTRSAPPVRSGPDDADGLLARASRDPSVVFSGYGGAYGGDDALARYAEEMMRTYGAIGGTLYGSYLIDSDAFDPSPWGNMDAPYERYTPITVTDGGTIEGVVTWPKPPRIAGELSVASGACGGRVDNRSLAIDRNGRVAGAIVYLEDIQRGRPLLGGTTGYGMHNRIQIGGTVIARGCELWPRVQLAAPIGAALRVSRRGPDVRALAVHPRDVSTPPIDVELPAEGTPAYAHLRAAGVFELVPGPGLPTRGWVMVPRHPYYTVTDERGHYRLDNVPPGSYRLTVWHPPLTSSIDAHGAPVLTAPFSRSRSVTVKAKRTANAPLRLP